MSIIERAAGKLGGNQPPAPYVSSPAFDRREETDAGSVIEAAIEKAEASFYQKPPEPVKRPVRQSAPDEDGPATIVGSQRGTVNLARLKLAGALTPDAGRSKIAEEYRLIKRPLLVNAFGHGNTAPIPNGNLIMVTSSVPGEGKSFTAINLAISMATELESTVLLIDADVTKSSVVRYLGLEADRGLLDVLRDPSVQLADVLIKTDIAKLTVLPSGRGFSHATELLASSAMKDFVRDISSRYQDRIIIFDCPPLLATSEASVLATYMGQIVFVVEAERTPQEAVKDALSHLVDCEHVGLVLNKAPTRTGGGDYYGYGYGYGGYGEYSQQQ
ncbi:MAG: protein tyrosine kinase [Hydrogenophilales bacterium 28-61-23]|nr:MAG: protein tyrosine kinase [Hydrogenophilales bacterium 28-61-23]